MKNILKKLLSILILPLAFIAVGCTGLQSDKGNDTQIEQEAQPGEGGLDDVVNQPETPDDSEDIVTSDDSENPETPVAPENPETPTYPETPETPTDPTGPEESETPETPTDPTGPEESETPETPTDPTGPEESENPETPTYPENPETPADPENPEIPTEPTDPETPGESEIPEEDIETSDDSENPETPVDPEEPEIPIEPGESENPETPIDPDEPEIPDDSENPETPVDPTEPEIPTESENPETPADEDQVDSTEPESGSYIVDFKVDVDPETFVERWPIECPMDLTQKHPGFAVNSNEGIAEYVADAFAGAQYAIHFKHKEGKNIVTVERDGEQYLEFDIYHTSPTKVFFTVNGEEYEVENSNGFDAIKKTFSIKITEGTTFVLNLKKCM